MNSSGVGVDELLFPHHDELAKLLRKAGNKDDYRRVLSLWLRVVFHSSLNQIAVAVGLSSSTVRRIYAEFRMYGTPSLFGARRGGAHRRYLSPEEESKLVLKYRKRTRYGAPLNVKALHDEFERRVGHTVARSTIYRLLARYGCRPLLPRARSISRQAHSSIERNFV